MTMPRIHQWSKGKMKGDLAGVPLCSEMAGQYALVMSTVEADVTCDDCIAARGRCSECSYYLDTVYQYCDECRESIGKKPRVPHEDWTPAL